MSVFFAIHLFSPFDRHSGSWIRVPTQTGKPGNSKVFSSQGKAIEFLIDWKSQGKSHKYWKTLEISGNYYLLFFSVI